MADNENTTDKSFLEEFLIPDRKDWEFLKDAGRFWGGAPTETGGILKNFLDRGGGSLLPGIYNFYQSTFGKGKEGEITVPFDKIQSDEKLSKYLDNMQEVHLRNNKDEIKNRSDEWNDHFWSLLEKYDLQKEYEDEYGLRFALDEVMNDDERAKLVDLGTAYDSAITPFQINYMEDEDLNKVPESLTFKDELFSPTPMEPDVKFINENTISFPYLGDYNLNEEGDFTMQHPSAFKPLDQPGYENFLNKIPGGEMAQKWQEYVTPEYSPEPELFRKPGWIFGGMMPATLAAVGPLAWKGAKWAAPYASKLSTRANPYIAGIMTALQAGKAEAPGIVPEGVEATPENLEKYGQILMGNQ